MSGIKTHRLPTPPSLVESPTHRFLIFDAPNDENLPLYIAEWEKFKVRNLVRTCDPTYGTEPLRSLGITVHDMPFADGGSPSAEIVRKWTQLLQTTRTADSKEKETIGVHCVAGLGRAPVLVAIALIESGVNALNAVELIRAKRSRAINHNQLTYLKNYHIISTKKRSKICTIL
eukprot:Phypoly_transcript_19223.p1 GENE.Phypoly_transcript_19223~~Phypoly_transcript_19223.p1  ORF type:complete len:174 (-),score=23.81 Phypoly_transcript_19223:46-567(-)